MIALLLLFQPVDATLCRNDVALRKRLSINGIAKDSKGHRVLIDRITGNFAQLTAGSLVKTRVSRAKRLFDVSDRFSAATASQAIQMRLQPSGLKTRQRDF
jgi:hypothetical protein